MFIKFNADNRSRLISAHILLLAIPSPVQFFHISSTKSYHRQLLNTLSFRTRSRGEKENQWNTTMFRRAIYQYDLYTQCKTGSFLLKRFLINCLWLRIVLERNYWKLVPWSWGVIDGRNLNMKRTLSRVPKISSTKNNSLCFSGISISCK